MATNNLSAQQNFLNQLKKGRLTQSQIEAGQRYADNSMPGYNFDSKLGYYKGTKPSSSPSSAQRSAQRKAKSAATGNTISKGGAAGLAGALGQYDTLEEKSLMAKMMFNPGSLTDVDKGKLGMTELIPQGYDNVPSGGVFDMVAEGRDPSKQYYSDGTYAGQVLSTTVPSQAMGGQTSITSGLEGLSGPQMDSPFNTGNFDKRQESTVGYRANGGPVEAGQPYIVGERGPELIYPSQDGNVLSNEMLQIAREFGIDPTGLSEDDLYQLLSAQSAKVPTQDGTMIGAQPFTPTLANAPQPQQGGQFRVAPDVPFVEPTSSPALPEGFFPSTPAPAPAEGGGVLDFFFGNPTPEQAQRTLQTQPTDPAQRERLQSIAQGTAAPSDLSQTGSFFFGRPEVAGDPNILGAAPVAEPTIATEAPSASPTPTQPQAPASDGSQIPKFGEEGFQFAERGSPQDFFLSQTNGGTTAFGPVDPNVQTAQGVNGTMNQQALLPEGLTASSPIPEGLVKAIGSDGKMVLTSPAEAARLNAIESRIQAEDRAAQQKFLASDKAKEFSNRQIRSSIMGDGQYGRDSAAREQRQAARPDFFEAQTRAVGTVTDRERRAARGEGMSDADRRDIAKANIRGASASDIARAMKVAELNNVDLQTGKSLDKKDTRRPDEVERDRLNLLRTQQIIEDGNKPDATKYEKDAYARQLAVGKGIINQAQADDANKRDLIGNPPSIYDSWAEYEAKTGIDQDKDGKVSTKEDAKAARLSKVELSRLQELLNKAKK